MAFVEIDKQDQIMIIKLNRPERLNALSKVIREGMANAFIEYRDDKNLEVAILTGEGRGFCAGEDMKESLEVGSLASAPGKGEEIENPFMNGNLDKPDIGAINGYAMGCGFMLVEKTDLRVAVKEAIFEMSEAKRWLLGGYNHGFYANLPHPVATEMALGFRFNAQRLYEVGFINRLVEKEELLPTSIEMAEHILSLPPAARVNTIYMMREMAPKVGSNFEDLADQLHSHGDQEDRMESRRAFAEKRKPNFNGWINPEDRYNMPKLKPSK